mmetsp:Transcript_7764/g.32702  ORF Transcript_7764/g.32702 Transcript_7764/m.32702 type:complete len:216 (+) Transcript_7764:1065-1712(+)
MFEEGGLELAPPLTFQCLWRRRVLERVCPHRGTRERGAVPVVEARHQYRLDLRQILCVAARQQLRHLRPALVQCALALAPRRRLRHLPPARRRAGRRAAHRQQLCQLLHHVLVDGATSGLGELGNLEVDEAEEVLGNLGDLLDGVLAEGEEHLPEVCVDGAWLVGEGPAGRAVGASADLGSARAARAPGGRRSLDAVGGGAEGLAGSRLRLAGDV